MNLREYQEKGISKGLAKRRLNYLIALNRKHKWASDRWVREKVDEAIEALDKLKPNSPRKGKRKDKRRTISAKAIKAAIKSRKTPKHLREALKKYAKKRGIKL